jgi:hypothetical protein
MCFGGRVVPQVLREADGRKKGCSFLKKRTKKLLDVARQARPDVHKKDQKSFASFLQKRRPLLSDRCRFRVLPLRSL